jgi:ATP-binding cassette subfamily F protein 3
VASLSGGERARLALALITRDAPHLLILDEPTNHLDVDSREALVQALNGYDGAVILVSHDRHMVELVADRLVLVDDGRAVDYAGSIDDYIDFILGRNQPKATKPAGKPKHKPGEVKSLKQDAANAEREVTRLAGELAEMDSRLSAGAHDAGLAKQRASLAANLEQAEARWLEIGEKLEALPA